MTTRPSQPTLPGLLASGAERIRRDSNPWWRGERLFGVPLVRRWAFAPTIKGLRNGLAPVTVLRGPRQVGKTTTLNQIIDTLLDDGVEPRRIFRVQFDDIPQLKRLETPVLDLVAWYADQVLGQSINAFAHAQGGPVYLLLDEVQNLSDWATQVKHVVDLQPVRAIVTGSSALRIEAGRMAARAGAAQRRRPAGSATPERPRRAHCGKCRRAVVQVGDRPRGASFSRTWQRAGSRFRADYR